ncbi:hypothetical protein PG991_000019 [Apiospora marii]|uniref:Uncharacterized protein n=1 Tax=Apiospora marii TaxID=335849 RepID=A0ABR1T0X5_9PEZI
MDPSTVPKKWDLSLSIQSTKARCRREEMLRYCGQVPASSRRTGSAGWSTRSSTASLKPRGGLNTTWPLVDLGLATDGK